ncbi:cysteine-rich repeat secretory protein 38-like [Macadamia integrifolia]|uniref:cysteine-rich repeat secretory protein 38-like n=1 Tax=Macadamia integrifolia TaxID=60698 RepID=UPI001C4EB2C4|nr:cysteine-rich repeat secretory protein 38-like [Macadamia integrifolia]
MPIPLHVSSSILLLLFSSSLQLVIADSSLTFVYHFYIEERGTYTSNSIFADNLNQVLSNLTSEAQLSGFNKTSIGFITDQVNGLYMCRGDVAADTCQFCIITASMKIQALCPNQKEVVIWYNLCMLRYSDRSFFSTAETYPSAHWYSNQNVSNMVQFDQLVKSSLESLANKTAFDPLTKMYVSNETNSGSFDLYSLLQCTQDLSPSGCYLCLKNAISGIQINGGTGRTWVMEVLPSCILQYSVALFYNTAPPPPPPQPISVVLSPPPLQSPSPVHSPVRALPSPSSTAPATNSTNHAAALFLAVGLLFYCLRRKRKDGLKPNDVSRNAPTKKNASKDEGNVK